MGYINFRSQTLTRLSGLCSKLTFRNLATRVDQSKAFRAKRITLGVGGALLTVGVAATFSSEILLEAEKPTSSKDGARNFSGFNPQSSDLQTDQVKLSQEKPGVFLWGANECGIAAPENVKETPIKLPRKNPFFESQAFRGIVFGLNHAVAINANGDLYQWGLGYFEDELEKNLAPELTLKGKDIIQVATSDKKIFALSRKGQLYVLSSAKKYQQLSEDEKTQGWSDYFWGSYPSVKFFKVEIPNPKKGERIKNIAAGQHHLAALTSDNRILTLQADAAGKLYGQLGTGNLDSAPTPSSSDDNAADYNLQFAEVKLPDAVTLDKVICGNNHTFLRTDSGRVFAFGANFLGQLGMGHFTMSKSVALAPQEITDKFGTGNQQLRTKVVDVAAGGDTSAFVVQQVDFDGNVKSVELYTCGFGQWGQLGNNRYMHVQGMPVKVPSFSSKFEYSEKLNRVVPVNVYKVSIGATHLFATLDNTSLSSDFGRDVYAWGENLDFQLGTGKRSNLNAPAPPLLPNYNKSSESQGSDSQSALQGRLQVARPSTISVTLPGKKGKHSVQVEQEIVAGFGVSAIYSKILL